MQQMNPIRDDYYRRHDDDRRAGTRQRPPAQPDTRWDMPAVRPTPPPRHAGARRTRWDMPALGGASPPKHRQDPGRRPKRPRPPQDDEAQFTHRQLAGLSALMSIAEPEMAPVPFSGPSVHLRYTGSFERTERQRKAPPPHTAGPTEPTGRLVAMWAFVRTDQMLRNSLYLVLNSGVQAALGFGFWIITARYFSTTSVGQASSLISATTLIAFLGLLGLNTALVRFLPITRQRNRLMTAALTLVAGSSAILAVFYVLLMPFISKPISFVAHNIPMALGFIALTIGGGVNVLTDSVFIAAGKAKYNAIVDGVIGGTAKIVLVVLLAGTGAYGVFGAATGGFLAAALASILLMARVLDWRPVFGDFGRILKPILRFSGMNYVGNILNLLPTLIVPLIVISRVGSSAAAYYYVAFQLASLLYSAAYSVEQAFLAEGAHTGSIDKAVLMRSARILLALCIPAFIVVLLFGHQMLSAFGANYGRNAESSLIPLTAAVFPIAAYNWSLTVLRLANRLRAIVWSNAVYAGAVIILALVLAPRGLGGVALSWPIGTTAGALVAGGAAISSVRRRRQSA
jgi:O-antigen/teichoic acid export membrane protein